MWCNETKRRYNESNETLQQCNEDKRNTHKLCKSKANPRKSGYGPLKHILHLKGATIDKKNGYGPLKKWSSPPLVPLQDQ